MQQVGLSQKEVKHAIHTQILTVFFLPLITAGIHVMFAYPIIRAILRAMMLSSETVFITCTVASFLVFSVLYAVVYALTGKGVLPHHQRRQQIEITRFIPAKSPPHPEKSEAEGFAIFV